jgi:predicted helicase
VPGHVNGQMSTAERAAELATLRAVGPGQRRVLTNARCLTEGVDVPAIDLVAFLDPKNSYVDIVQAIGRVLRLADGKTVGTILLAVYIGDGENAEDVIASTRFAGIRAVLEVLRDEDPDFAAALAAAGPPPGRRGATSPDSGPGGSPRGAGVRTSP